MEHRNYFLVFFVIGYLVVNSVSRPFEDKLMDVLRNLSEEDLEVLEKLQIPVDEDMLGDQPQPWNDTVFENGRKVSWEVLGGRDREQRLRSIKKTVLIFVGRDGKTNSTLPQASKQQTQIMHEVFKQAKNQWPPEDVFTEKIQSFYPSCELPKNTDEELWEGGQAMNLHFDLQFPKPPQGLIVGIQSANLRLYKHLQPQGETDESKKPFLPYPSSGTATDTDERRIRVSVYYYTRSLKRYRIKKKLLDSQMLSFYGDEWTELNVRQAVNSWRENGKNFGISVEVEDEDRVILQASKYFSPMNCSKDATTVRPIPGFLIDVLQNKTALGKTGIYVYPMIDLATVEYPEKEVAIRYPMSGQAHKLRHQHHRSTQPPPVNDSMEQINWEDPTKS